ncbi:hypothetical protein LUZ61_009258 [Rhynchospora tenuis]|uniref:F-box domain-containing protein n=1 Tax=Rhynchospora tenuis TaxID=198213 RepID=A0AAD6EYG9_9POAL|nr:hypothetical protein LUZ61_009258 [Rhynchospora tenuis]
MENISRVPLLSPKDMFSRLPAEILLVILSLLPRSDAAAMRCLSRTWRQFNDSVFLSFFCDKFDCLGEEEYKQHVENTIKSRKEKDLEAFQVIWLDVESDEWLDYAVRNHAKSIHVIYLGNKWVDLPESLSSSAFLEELALFRYSRRVKILPNELDLGALRRLIFLSLYISEDFMNNVDDGCPVLEELHFVRCKLEFQWISSLILRKLTVERCNVGIGSDEDRFSIDTPNLEHLHYNAVWHTYLWNKQARMNYRVISEYKAFPYPVNNFYCPHLDKVEIICWKQDWRVRNLVRILDRYGGVSSENVKIKFAPIKDCFRAGTPMLKTLNHIWNWINAHRK